jgi:hypothetical protein
MGLKFLKKKDEEKPATVVSLTLPYPPDEAEEVARILESLTAYLTADDLARLQRLAANPVYRSIAQNWIRKQ